MLNRKGVNTIISVSVWICIGKFKFKNRYWTGLILWIETSLLDKPISWMLKNRYNFVD